MIKKNIVDNISLLSIYVFFFILLLLLCILEIMTNNYKYMAAFDFEQNMHLLIYLFILLYGACKISPIGLFSFNLLNLVLLYTTLRFVASSVTI